MFLIVDVAVRQQETIACARSGLAMMQHIDVIRERESVNTKLGGCVKKVKSPRLVGTDITYSNDKRRHARELYRDPNVVSDVVALIFY